jgi:beta-glucosidase
VRAILDPILCLLLLGLCLLAVACGDQSAGSGATADYRDPKAPVEARVNDLLSRMTLEEKVAQMVGSALENGTFHTSDNQRLGITGFHMVDGSRGVSPNAGNATAFPVAMARGATWDPDLEAQVGEAIGREARARDANVLLAPVINILRHPAWGRAQETYGEDTVHLGAMGAGFIRGAQRHVVANTKHFAVYSIEDNRFKVDVHIDERTLREVYLPHFKAAVDAGTGSIMSAYNRVNGEYCGQNAHLLHDILKGEWGFKGFVESDWVLGTQSTAASAIAGLDIEMPFPKYYGDPLVAAVGDGSVPESAIDDAVRRILRTKFAFGIFDGLPAEDPAVIESPEHEALALDVERKAIVLLKNDAVAGGAALPLDRSAITSLAVVGALADKSNLGDTGSSVVVSRNIVKPLDGIRDRAGNVPLVSVTTDTPSSADFDEIAAASTAVVVVGLTAKDEGEQGVGGGDRKTLGLSAEHEQLILSVAARNPRTIVVIEGGSAITMEAWVDAVPAIVMAWYPGVQGGNAIGDVLFGNVNPSGKLPITFARSADQLPPFIINQNEVTYDYYHGYRLLDRDGAEPRFPFGFGLSYTNFAYSDLTVADARVPPDGTIRASVQVTNTGPVAGDEIVELYVSAEGSRVDRPVRELKAFRRVHLEAGQSQRVELTVDARSLAFWDVDSSTWVVEQIPYTIAIGRSSRDLPLSAQVTLGGANSSVRDWASE